MAEGGMDAICWYSGKGHKECSSIATVNKLHIATEHITTVERDKKIVNRKEKFIKFSSIYN